jgi:hypothetical protein
MSALMVVTLAIYVATGLGVAVMLCAGALDDMLGGGGE